MAMKLLNFLKSNIHLLIDYFETQNNENIIRVPFFYNFYLKYYFMFKLRDSNNKKFFSKEFHDDSKTVTTRNVIQV